MGRCARLASPFFGAALDLQAGAGNALCDLLSARAAAAAAAAAVADPSSSAATAAAAAAENQLALEGQLLEELLVRAPDAHWARARLAGLQLQLRQYESAVSSYQAAIRWVCRASACVQLLLRLDTAAMAGLFAVRVQHMPGY